MLLILMGFQRFYSEVKEVYQILFSTLNSKKIIFCLSLFSYGTKNENTLKVVSAELVNNQLINKKTIFEALPYRRSSNHYGARLVFLNDNSLIITSGDGFNYREDAQNLDNHFGKIIRINIDGSIPEDNPYIDTPDALPEIFSYGHRNQQGIAYDSKMRYYILMSMVHEAVMNLIL